MQLNQYIDHTLLKPTATVTDIKKLSKEAKTYNFFSVCINSCYISLAKAALKNTDVKICTVIGFPLGATDTKTKVEEAKEAIKNGADEIDMVINIGFLKSKLYDEVYNDIAQVKKAIGNKILKVIIETCYLTDDEKKIACQLALKTNTDFIKTSTGFGTGGATFEDVKLMKEVVKNNAQIKASGGIKDFETAKKYIDLGVSRLGTSNGVAIVKHEKGIINY